MTDFIILTAIRPVRDKEIGKPTHWDLAPILVNLQNLIVATPMMAGDDYYGGKNYTTLVLLEEADLNVVETPEQILALRNDAGVKGEN
jgi:hypothetical protein